MNYDFIVTQKPLHHIFRPIGTVLVLLMIAFGIVFKISPGAIPMDIGIFNFRFFFLLFLVITLLSKPKNEDERSEELNLQIVKLGYWIIVTFWFLIEMGGPENVDRDNLLSSGSFYFILTSTLSLQILMVHVAKFSNITEFIDKNNILYQFALMAVFLPLLFFYRWLWAY